MEMKVEAVLYLLPLLAPLHGSNMTRFRSQSGCDVSFCIEEIHTKLDPYRRHRFLYISFARCLRAKTSYFSLKSMA